MSDEQDPNEETGPDSAPSEDAGAPDDAKDLPIPIVVAAITLAVVVFGFVGWQRYQDLRADTLRELQAMQAREIEAGRADAHRMAAEKAAAKAAESTPTDEGSPATETEAPASGAPATQPASKTP